MKKDSCQDVLSPYFPRHAFFQQDILLWLFEKLYFKKFFKALRVTIYSAYEQNRHSSRKKKNLAEECPKIECNKINLPHVKSLLKFYFINNEIKINCFTEILYTPKMFKIIIFNHYIINHLLTFK